MTSDSIVVTTIHKFHLTGPGSSKRPTVGDTGTVRWNVTPSAFWSDKHASLHGSFTVSQGAATRLWGRAARPAPRVSPH